jgi:hypothetical protein
MVVLFPTVNPWALRRVLGARCWVLADASIVCGEYARIQHLQPMTVFPVFWAALPARALSDMMRKTLVPALPASSRICTSNLATIWKTKE